MPATLRIALDENFPLILIPMLDDVLPGIELRSVYDIDPRFEGLDEWEVVVALFCREWHVLATSDVRMLNGARALMALEQTHTTLVAVEALGHDAVRATGALLLELPGLAKRYVPGKAQVFRWRPREPRPEPPQHYVGIMSKWTGRSVQEPRQGARLSDEDLRDPLARRPRD